MCLAHGRQQPGRPVMKREVVTCDVCGATLTPTLELHGVRLIDPWQRVQRAEVCSVACAADWLLRIHEREARGVWAELA